MRGGLGCLLEVGGPELSPRGCRARGSCEMGVVGLREYAGPDALKAPGSLKLRPWMINFDKDLGLKGFIEPAVALESFLILNVV